MTFKKRKKFLYEINIKKWTNYEFENKITDKWTKKNQQIN